MILSLSIARARRPRQRVKAPVRVLFESRLLAKASAVLLRCVRHRAATLICGDWFLLDCARARCRRLRVPPARTRPPRPRSTHARAARPPRTRRVCVCVRACARARVRVRTAPGTAPTPRRRCGAGSPASRPLHHVTPLHHGPASRPHPLRHIPESSRPLHHVPCITSSSHPLHHVSAPHP